MVYIVIKDDSGFCVELEEDFDYNVIDCSYHLFQPVEVGYSIAHQLIGADFNVTEKIINERIDEYLEDVRSKIKDTVISTLDDNEMRVY